MAMTLKLVAASSCLALSLSAGAGIAAASPDTSAIVNSTCSYPQVVAALNDQSPDVANELSTSPLATIWLQQLVAAPPDQRQQMVAQAQNMPSLQQYMPVIIQVANTCSRY
jgi:hemophore-related protein